MSNITVCARFRPLSSKERRDHGDALCIQYVDSETFIFKDEKAEELTFSFDRVFYDKSEQIDVYRHLAQPIVQDALNAINGTIITFGQTGAGKTYSMEGPGVLECDAVKKGLLSRVVEGIFECTKSSDDTSKYSIKLSMVEIYMEKVRYKYICYWYDYFPAIRTSRDQISRS
uniref:Kinesin motor domain-containing protein n=1 Tax=Cucumis sativus TaxID=3659 RepID=A0A0A0LY07_CUCSA